MWKPKSGGWDHRVKCRAQLFLLYAFARCRPSIPDHFNPVDIQNASLRFQQYKMDYIKQDHDFAKAKNDADILAAAQPCCAKWHPSMKQFDGVLRAIRPTLGTNAWEISAREGELLDDAPEWTYAKRVARDMVVANFSYHVNTVLEPQLALRYEEKFLISRQSYIVFVARLAESR